MDSFENSSTGSAPHFTTFAPSTRVSVPYVYQEPDEPESAYIGYPVRRESDASASRDVYCCRHTCAEDDPEVPSHLQELYDETVERSKLSSANWH